MFFQYISLRIFLISLAVGLLFVYLSQPSPTVVLVYPTPENAGTIAYKDKASNCFTFEATEVTCPTDAGSLKTIPMQK
jgi:hypothetical protein